MSKKIVSYYHPILKKRIDVPVNFDVNIRKEMTPEERAAHAANVRWGNTSAKPDQDSGSSDARQSSKESFGSKLKRKLKYLLTGKFTPSPEAQRQIEATQNWYDKNRNTPEFQNFVSGRRDQFGYTVDDSNLNAEQRGRLAETESRFQRGWNVTGFKFEKPVDFMEFLGPQMQDWVATGETKKFVKEYDPIESSGKEFWFSFAQNATPEQTRYLDLLVNDTDRIKTGSNVSSVDNQSLSEQQQQPMQQQPVQQPIQQQPIQPQSHVRRKPGNPIEAVGKLADSKSESLDNLLENPFNRELDRKKIDNIKEDIKSSNKVYPLVFVEIDHDGNKAKLITDGHHRYQALKELGYKKVPVIMQDDRGLNTKGKKSDVTKK